MPAIGLNIGKAVAYLELDTSGFRQGFKTAGQELDRFKDNTQTAGTRINALGNTFKSVGSTMTKDITTPLLGVGAGALTAGMNFEQGMAQVKAISGATGKDFDKLRDKAVEMGAKTKFSATESAEAMNYMAMAGWKTEDMLAGIEPVMNLAAAAGTDLAITSDIVTDALTGFGLTAKDTERFVDVLSATMSNSNTNVEMLGESFKYVAPVAGSLGYTVEDTAFALGLMANSGIKASQAGTSLRTIMTNMVKPTSQMQVAMDKLGISLDDGNGNMKSFRQVMDELRVSFGDIMISEEEFNEQLAILEASLANGTITQKEYDKSLDELMHSAYGAEGAEKARLAAMLAGKEAMPGLLALINATEEDYNKLSDAIVNSKGVTQDMVDIMMNTAKGAIEIFKSSLETAGIQISDVIGPVFRDFAETITDMVVWFTNLDEGTQKFIIKMGALFAVLGPVLSIVGNIVGLFGGLFTVFGKIVGVIGTIGGGFGKLVEGMQGAHSILGLLSGAFKGLWGIMLAHPILTLITIIGTLILTNEECREVLGKVWTIIKEVVINSVKDAIEWIGNLGKKIKDFFTGADKDTDEHKKKQKKHNEEIKNDADKGTKEAGEKRKKNTKEADEAIEKNTKEFAKLQSQAHKGIANNVVEIARQSSESRVNTAKDANTRIQTSTEMFKTNQISSFVSLGNGITKNVNDTNNKRISSDEKTWSKINSNTRVGATNLIGQFSNMGTKISETAKTTGNNVDRGVSSGNDRALISTMKFETQSTRAMGAWANFIARVGREAGFSVGAEIDRGRVQVGNSLVKMHNQSLSILKNFSKNMNVLGKNSINSFVSGINSGMQAARNAIQGIASLGQSIANSVGQWVNGRHSLGLDYVPYDGYIAELHKGERVLTRAENEVYTNGNKTTEKTSTRDGISGGGDTFNFYNTKPDPYTYYRQMKRAKRELIYET